jgi:hypothetical protein
MKNKDLNKTQEINITSLRLLRYDCAQGDHNTRLEVSGSLDVRNDFVEQPYDDNFEDDQKVGFFKKLLTPLGHHLSKQPEPIEIEMADIFDFEDLEDKEGDNNEQVIHDLVKWDFGC